MSSLYCIHFYIRKYWLTCPRSQTTRQKEELIIAHQQSASNFLDYFPFSVAVVTSYHEFKGWKLHPFVVLHFRRSESLWTISWNVGKKSPRFKTSRSVNWWVTLIPCTKSLLPCDVTFTNSGHWGMESPGSHYWAYQRLCPVVRHTFYIVTQDTHVLQRVGMSFTKQYLAIQFYYCTFKCWAWPSKLISWPTTWKTLSKLLSTAVISVLSSSLVWILGAGTSQVQFMVLDSPPLREPTNPAPFALITHGLLDICIPHDYQAKNPDGHFKECHWVRVVLAFHNQGLGEMVTSKMADGIYLDLLVMAKTGVP